MQTQPVSPERAAQSCPPLVEIRQTLLMHLLQQHYGLSLNDTPFSDERVITQHIDAGFSLADALNFHVEKYELVRIVRPGFSIQHQSPFISTIDILRARKSTGLMQRTDYKAVTYVIGGQSSGGAAMKLSLTVEADAINVLALNMGKIAVDIDGIELADLISVVCDNGYSLRIADAPGKLVVEDPLPPIARVNGIQCSTTHITEADNTLLFTLSHQNEDFGDSEWILYTGSGYLLHLGAWSFPVLRLKRLGLSKACRRLVVSLMRRYSVSIVHLDACGEVLSGFTTFDW